MGSTSHFPPSGRATRGASFFNFKGGPPEASQVSAADRKALFDTFFGEPTVQSSNLSEYEGRNESQWNLPSNYLGKSQMLTSVVELGVFSADNFLTQVILPLKKTDQLSVAWEETRFDPKLTAVVPHRGRTRLLSLSRSSGSATMIRRGIGIELEHGFMTTEKGRSTYIGFLHQINNSVVETNNYSVLVCLLNCHTYGNEVSRIRRDYTPKQVTDRFERELKLWSIIQKEDRPLQALNSYVSREMESCRGKANTWILPSKVSQFVATVPEAYLEFWRAGSLGPAVVSQGVNSFSIVPGMSERVYSCSSIDTCGDGPIDLLRRPTEYGEYYSAFDIYRGNYDDYKTIYRTIRIYDEFEDRFVPFSMEWCINNCHRFNENGTLISHNDVDRFRIMRNSSDERQHALDRDVFRTPISTHGPEFADVNYFGQIRREHLSVTDIAGVARTALKSINYSSKTDINVTMNGLYSAISYLSNLKYTKAVNTWFTVLAQYNAQYGDTVNPHAPHGITEVSSNEHSSLRLPPLSWKEDIWFASDPSGKPSRFNDEATLIDLIRDHGGERAAVPAGLGAVTGVTAPYTNTTFEYISANSGKMYPMRNTDIESLQLPPGFLSWAGFCTIAETYRTSPGTFTSTYGWNLDMVKNITDGVDLINALSAQIAQVFSGCATNNPTYASPWFHKSTAAHTLFESLIDTHHLPGFILYQGIDGYDCLSVEQRNIIQSRQIAGAPGALVEPARLPATFGIVGGAAAAAAAADVALITSAQIDAFVGLYLTARDTAGNGSKHDAAMTEIETSDTFRDAAGIPLGAGAGNVNLTAARARRDAILALLDAVLVNNDSVRRNYTSAELGTANAEAFLGAVLGPGGALGAKTLAGFTIAVGQTLAFAAGITTDGNIPAHLFATALARTQANAVKAALSRPRHTALNALMFAGEKFLATIMRETLGEMVPMDQQTTKVIGHKRTIGSEFGFDGTGGKLPAVLNQDMYWVFSPNQTQNGKENRNWSEQDLLEGRDLRPYTRRRFVGDLVTKGHLAADASLFTRTTGNPLTITAAGHLIRVVSTAVEQPGWRNAAGSVDPISGFERDYMTTWNKLTKTCLDYRPGTDTIAKIQQKIEECKAVPSPPNIGALLNELKQLIRRYAQQERQRTVVLAVLANIRPVKSDEYAGPHQVGFKQYTDIAKRALASIPEPDVGVGPDELNIEWLFNNCMPENEEGLKSDKHTLWGEIKKANKIVDTNEAAWLQDANVGSRFEILERDFLHGVVKRGNLNANIRSVDATPTGNRINMAHYNRAPVTVPAAMYLSWFEYVNNAGGIAHVKKIPAVIPADYEDVNRAIDFAKARYLDEIKTARSLEFKELVGKFPGLYERSRGDIEFPSLPPRLVSAIINFAIAKSEYTSDVRDPYEYSASSKLQRSMKSSAPSSSSSLSFGQGSRSNTTMFRAEQRQQKLNELQHRSQRQLTVDGLAVHETRSREIDGKLGESITIEFEENMKAINTSTMNFLERILAKSFLFTRITRQTLLHMAESNIVIPFTFHIAKPHIQHNTLSAIKVQAGGETGYTYMGHSIFAFGDDAATQFYNATYTYYARAIVHRPENVYVAQSIFCDGLIRGNGSAPYTKEEYEPHKNSYGSETASVFCFLGPYTEQRLGEKFDITGAFRIFGSKFGDEEGPHASFSEFYNHYWGFEDFIVNFNSSEEMAVAGGDVHTFNTVVYEGCFQAYDKHDQGFTLHSPGKGRWGAGHTHIGSKHERSGAMTRFNPTDYTLLKTI